MNIGIIGLGLIGGSMAIDLRRRGFADRLVGMDADKVNAAAALKIGLVDEIVSEDECVEKSDIIIVAVPVDFAVKVVCRVLDRFQKEGWSDKVVMDVCSTKEQIAQATMYHACRKQYVATHPMAGTEYSGPWAAMANLFDSKVCIIADQQESSPKALDTVQKLYDALNMRVSFMSVSAHDVHTAYVSHLSHVVSFALANTVLDKEKDEKHIFDLASSGFSSTARLAKSNADMWTPIFIQNKDNIVRVTDAFIQSVQELRDAIDSMDETAIRSFIDEANRIKRIIK